MKIKSANIKDLYMMVLFKRILDAIKLVSFGSSAPWAMDRPKMSDDCLTREKLQELLACTPRLPVEQ